jgi:16S rRNA (adenine1518-N6/adenine1519-N6)-dimethyltransferase
VKAAWWAEAHVVGRVAPSVFVPPPRVESGLVEVVRRAPAGDDAERQAVFALVEAGYGQRRKMLRRSLVDRVPAGAFAAAGVRPEARAEELVLADWQRLAAAVAAH